MKIILNHKCESKICQQNLLYADFKDGDLVDIAEEDPNPSSALLFLVERRLDNYRLWVCRNCVAPEQTPELQFTDFKQILKDL